MRFHGGSTHKQSELHRDVVMGMREQAADMAGERVVVAIATAAAVANAREILQIILISKGEAGPLLAGHLLFVGFAFRRAK